jgi:hypothetical protein
MAHRRKDWSMSIGIFARLTGTLRNIRLLFLGSIKSR